MRSARCSSLYQRLNSASLSAGTSAHTIKSPLPFIVAIAVLLSIGCPDDSVYSPRLTAVKWLARMPLSSPGAYVMPTPDPRTTPFRLEEATIDEMHAAIRAGEITCVQIVQHYIDRARAFNGVASALVTEDGRPVRPAPGAVRAGAPLRFPTETVKASTLFPDLDRYK